MSKELDRVNKKIKEINAEIDAINAECAMKVAMIAGETQKRILSYNQEEEMNNSIEQYTKRLSKLIVELEDLELLRKHYMKDKK